MATSFEERVVAVERLTRLFRAERVVYLLASLLSVALLLFCAFAIVVENGPNAAALSTLFGSTGILSLAIGRLLTMWTQAMRLVAGAGLGAD